MVSTPSRIAGAVLLTLLGTWTAGDASPRPRLKDISYSAAFWFDVCTGQRSDATRQEQDALCFVYLSSFVEATDEYGDAGFRLFCPPDALPLESLRRLFIAYTAELPDSAAYLPGGRVMVQALMRAYPCGLR
jgi:hypothetical protein